MLSTTAESRGEGPSTAERPLEELRDDIIDEVKSSRKELNDVSSCRAEYWSGRAIIAEQQMQQVEMRFRIAFCGFCQIQNPRMSEKSWLRTRAAKKLFCEWKGYLLDKKLYENQAERLQKKSRTAQVKQAVATRRFTDFFTKTATSTDAEDRPQDLAEQRKFRSKTIMAYNATRPHPLSEDLWCPILRNYFSAGGMRVAQIFSHRHGQELMDGIFGTEEGQKNALLSPQNGLLMIAEAEERFRKGLFVIVPSTKNESSCEIARWHSSNPKRYKIRVIDRKAYKMTRSPPGCFEMRWNDLDGQELEFRSEYRPRSQYLYFHYCVAMLRRSWYHSERNTLLSDRFGNKFWDTPGSYLSRKLLLGFAAEFKHDGVLEGAEDGGEEEVQDQIALAAANNAIRFSEDKGIDLFTDTVDDNDVEDKDTTEDENDGKYADLGFGVYPYCYCQRCSLAFRENIFN